MMLRHPDILFTTEYIKNVLYFATVRNGKLLKSTSEVHYFCTDNELVYENYYSDFGPLNLGCVYKYCKLLKEKLKTYLNKQTIVHYTSNDPRKKSNAAFLIGCYGVLYLSLTPRDAIKPLILHGQNYRPFQDATQGDSIFTISLLDCLCAIKKARDLGFFNFQDFNFEEYDRLDRIQGGDLNWIVPGKFLAFIGPVDHSVSLYHPPEMYIDYFKENGVKIVIRLNKRMYDGNVFNNAGIVHYDLFFHDGSCPPRHILLKFLKIAEESPDAIAVHCKAGLGRTGSLIGCYLIKHYRMTAHEAIGWMRICRPGSVIGHQQGWLEHLESWLIKQGNLYRKRTFQDTEKFPIHEFGIYSLTEKVMRQKLVVRKNPSPPPPIQRQTRSDTSPPVRPQASKLREAPSKVAEKELDWRMRSPKNSATSKGRSREKVDAPKSVTRRSCGAGEPRLTSAGRPTSRTSTVRLLPAKTVRETGKEPSFTPMPTFKTTQGPMIKNLSEAKDYLLQTSYYSQQRENRLNRMNQLNPSITVTPHYTSRVPNYPVSNSANNTTTPVYMTVKAPIQQRRRLGLGRSPSPSPSTSPIRVMDRSRATNTVQLDKLMKRDSKATLRKALSRLKLASPPRDGSVGAASLGARRDAPPAQRAPSVRSDERPVATQGDMLNSIKFQRRYRDTLNADKISAMFNEKVNMALKEKAAARAEISKLNSTSPSRGFNTDHHNSSMKEQKSPRTLSSTSKSFGPPRTSSPKGRNRPSFY